VENIVSFTDDYPHYVNEPSPRSQRQHLTCQSCAHYIVHILLPGFLPTTVLLVSE
jgi:hypothetical protein